MRLQRVEDFSLQGWLPLSASANYFSLVCILFSLMLLPEHRLLLVEAMVLSIIGGFIEAMMILPILFPSELIIRAFEVIQPVFWQGVPPDLLVVFAAMALLDSLFA